MGKQFIFIVILAITIGIFLYSISKFIIQIRKSKKAYPIKNIRKRIMISLKVAFFQTKIFRFPLIGFFHALTFWGFLVICVGSLEMVVDGITGSERVLSSLGILYDIITASGDIFGLLVLASIIIFLVRRIFMHVKRFYGIEMHKKNKIDANVALTLILLLMISLIGMNIAYVAMTSKINVSGTYPISNFIAGYLITHSQLSIVNYQLLYEISWWSHILLIFIFANYLPYSKHFHVFMSIPNVFFSSLEPLGKLSNMDNITKEVKLMLNPDTAFTAHTGTETPPSRFGVKDVEDGTWKNFIDSLSCTQCGRCTSVCPANITGKKLSPRKILTDYRARFNELQRKSTPDSLLTAHYYLRGYVSEEELWACTTCNACAQECPVNINHPSLIVDARRYLVMEEGSAPANLKSTFSNIENNGAPWQFSSQDRLNWANELYINKSTVHGPQSTENNNKSTVHGPQSTENNNNNSKSTVHGPQSTENNNNSKSTVHGPQSTENNNNSKSTVHSPQSTENINKIKVEVPVMAAEFAKGNRPEYLFWVGCSGAFDDRYKKVARAFAKILTHLNISYAVLGTEESCNGDPARRAGNEMLFQMQALTNIEILKGYEVQKILTICPHCFNTMKNEYPDLDGKFEVIHYTKFFEHLIKEGKLHIGSGTFKNRKITFHDPCYLGRGNGEYDAPRNILNNIGCENIEMKRNKSFGLCCGGGGAQMFKEAEKGDKEVYIERIEEALETKAEIVATSCPFCMTMLTDGLKYKNKEEEIFNYDIIELVAETLEL